MAPITADTSEAITIPQNPVILFVIIALVTVAPAAPERIPHTSPTISPNILATLSAFFFSFIASFAPRTFLDAIALKGFMSQAVIATLNISATIAIKTKTSITTIDTAIPALDKDISLNTPKHMQIANEIASTASGHLIAE